MRVVLLIVVTCTLAAASGGRVDAAGPSEFVGSTPCDALPRAFVGVRAGAACERISWRLTLTSEPADTLPGTFELAAVYGMQARNDPGFVDGGTSARLQGTWTTVKGAAADPAALVYRITAANPRRSLDFVLWRNNLLHPLNDDRTLMVGSASWSYTLSRRPPVAQSENGGTAPATIATKPPSSRERAAADVAGVFEGRSPCQDLARLLNVAAGPECTKIKWRLTLYQNRITSAPDGYKLEGFVFRNPPRTGTWAIRSTASDSRTVYQLDPERAGGFLSLLKADDNILLFLDQRSALFVGDEFYSYTLNRTR